MEGLIGMSQLRHFSDDLIGNHLAIIVATSEDKNVHGSIMGI